ncbi:hypothetical protein GCM10009677_02850 [Sphaerisporangium rubeum]|uniref:Phosphatase PAP2 family protein n=1 Tax=Sphaerisporangium rubeum TaxID=321317 RepID=A0A7X0IDP6_9ACTN|nr:hypothetical protein [Sphaerisporangium rubeum]MBB6473236.1 hypothetical protein [Sphaerisporangium rubeum]
MEADGVPDTPPEFAPSPSPASTPKPRPRTMSSPSPRIPGTPSTSAPDTPRPDISNTDLHGVTDIASHDMPDPAPPAVSGGASHDVTGTTPAHMADTTAQRGGYRVARWITDVFAPQVLVIGMPPVVGLLSDGWRGAAWGLVASALCGGVPAAVIAAGVRSGRLDSHHIVDRSLRTRPLLVAVAAVLAALALLSVLGAPTLLLATVGAMLAGLAVTVPVTLWWKISFHAAVTAGTVVVFSHVLPPTPTLAAGTLITAAVCWSRIRVTHHTLPQVLAGVAAGATPAWLVLTLAGT